MILKRILTALDAIPEAGAGKVPASVLNDVDSFVRATRGRAIHLGKVTNAEFAQALRERIERAVKGGRENGLAQLRMELKNVLRDLNYTPETGFPGDTISQSSRVKAGTIQDLSSDFRLDFILDTQVRLHQGEAQRNRGQDPTRKELFPAWELVRLQQRKVPRGSAKSRSPGWPQRWFALGGPVVKGGRLIALKDDPIWPKLGSSRHYSDCLDVDHPPFAYNSGKGWREVPLAEVIEVGLMEAGESFEPSNQPGGEDPAWPDPVNSTRNLDDDLRRELREQLKAEGGDNYEVRYNRAMEEEIAAAGEEYDRRSAESNRRYEEFLKSVAE